MSSPDAGAVAIRQSEGVALLDVARESIRHGLAGGGPLAVDPRGFEPALREPGASFVTLRIDGALRGCTGSLEARRALVVDVASNAHGTAFGDPRFAPLSEAEFSRLSLCVSVLSPLALLEAGSRSELLAALRPGVDGLVLREGGASSTFLPAVWRSLPEPAAFLGELLRKAGLPRDHWSDSIRVERYTVAEFGEPG